MKDVKKGHHALFWLLVLSASLTLLDLIFFSGAGVLTWLIVMGLLVLAGVAFALLVKVDGDQQDSNALFPEHATLEALMPQQALNLYRNGLLPSLTHCYVRQSKKLEAEALQLWVHQIVQAVRQTFERAFPNSVLYQVQEQRNRDHAVVALLFVVSVVRVLKEEARTQVFGQPVSPYRGVFDAFPLTRLFELLFRESYRLYELSVLVAEEPAPLVFNRDVDLFLRGALSPRLLANPQTQKKKKKRKKAAGQGEALTVAVSTAGEAALVEKPPTHFSSEIEIKVDTAPAKSPSESSSDKPKSTKKKKSKTKKKKAAPIQEVVPSSTEQPPVQQASEASGSLAYQKYQTWLVRQLKRQAVNTGKYFYTSKRFDPKTVFVAEAGWEDLSRKAQVDVGALKRELVELGDSDGLPYRLVVGETITPLTRVLLDQPLVKPAPLPDHATLEECV